MNPVLLDTSRHDLSYEPTTARPTPRTGVAFSEVVGRSAASLVQEAGSAVQQLPGGPMLAAALRSGSAVAPGAGLNRAPMRAIPTPNLTGSPTLAATGVPPAPGAPAPPTGAGSSTGAAEGPGATAGDGTQSIDGTLQNSQDMNLYYLQLQEAMAAENRSYTACSNVLKARHDTVKNAIGNIR